MSPKCVCRACFLAIPIDCRSNKRWDIGLENTVLLKLILLTVNTDGVIGAYVYVKSKRPKTLTVAWGLSPLGWGQESSRSWSPSFSVIAMVIKVVIDGATDGD